MIGIEDYADYLAQTYPGLGVAERYCQLLATPDYLLNGRYVRPPSPRLALRITTINSGEYK